MCNAINLKFINLNLENWHLGDSSVKVLTTYTRYVFVYIMGKSNKKVFSQFYKYVTTVTYFVLQFILYELLFLR